MPEAALRWIAGLLQGQRIPFLICGGLAAIGYGSRRPLHDIDLFVPGDHFAQAVALGAQYLSKPAQHYCEAAEGWDLEYVQFRYQATKIEIGNAANARIWDTAVGRWVALELDFARCQYRPLLGIEVPLMERADLIAYKRRLGRPVDLEDIAAIAPPE